MILLDTSVWADHLRKGDARVSSLLDEGMVVMHAFVLGELALGYLHPREDVLGNLLELPSIHTAEPEEVLFLIEQQRLVAVGLGYVDVHLLAAVLGVADCRLWTRDKRLAATASRLGVAADPIN